MNPVTLKKSDADNADYDALLSFVDSELENLQPGEKKTVTIVLENDDEIEDEEGDEE